MKLIIFFVLMPISLSISSCISFLPQRPPIKEAIFRSSLQQVWLASEKALANYPIAESNIDSGVLKTDYLRGPNCWSSPGHVDNYSAGVRCSLTLQFIKIPENGIRVRITKTQEIVRDFVAEPERISSDGLEELSVLYRIDRELTIAREIQHTNKSSE